MNNQLPKAELESRMMRFRKIMTAACPDWQIVLIVSKVNMYYFTGTMQDGLLVILREGENVLWVRRSFERACDESLFEHIKPMASYRDAASHYQSIPKTVYLETEIVPLSMYQRIQKYFGFTQFLSADAAIAKVRAVKSSFELSLMEQSGLIHQKVLEQQLPLLLHEGMSETDLAAELFKALLAEGHHGLSRFSMFDTEIVLGHICFGESSLYPSYFNGPGGNYGMSPAVPILGNRERKLKKGDLVFVDVGCGVDGYHTDKTMTYTFERALCDKAVDAHNRCLEIQDAIAGQLKPGMVPADIYRTIIASLDESFLENFMGYASRQVKFLGHGIGLQVDELPVIAEGFTEPLVEGMAFAVEPKKGIAQVGMVGIENTFFVTPDGGRCITGTSRGLLLVE